ncbi:hypothetical protein ALQ08_104112 [Pseudomonas syringae pv. delphinii]|uniref:Uncharacterized protein n=1 Tax=Pseudomonas syringae pv. delphinii TaxID=192088 RepID=A0A0P9QA17_9PSED|nr:hypothetical protein ALO72_103378 [Pseudomonas syringae pv. delphinii]RMP15602.1 hypothetical protein ALQ28_103895 [Pseudomonas syringae pv. delphinii]RMP25000.1 hypothetical protein ALQ27_104188 [Pseudomonas syringae pv. delphinii]RMQ26055.1 hypothetical protein ALQ08_104112 [Pseudomonas syringae pv. delphinii]
MSLSRLVQPTKARMAVKKRTVPKPNANFMLTLIFAKLLFIKSPDYAFLSALKELKTCFYGQQNRAPELSAAQAQNFIKKKSAPWR